ncbi:MAG: ABC transporter ATP-binding protein [Halobacteriaceae archaeon]
MALELTDLEQSFAEFDLGPVSLSIDAEVVSVLGPSGSGKTTLLSLVAGLQDPIAGRISLHDTLVTDRPPEDRGIAMVFQEGALFPHLSARENVTYAATDPARVETVATTLGVETVLDRPATALSGGERQRIALARAVAADPDALLLDEPLANLDAPVRERLRADLRETLADLGVPVLHVTHDQRAAAAIGDRIAVMRDGHIDHIGTPETVFTRPATPFVARFTGSTVVTGLVTERGTVEWGGYPLLEAPPELGPGQHVDLAVRPAAIGLDQPPPDADRATAIVGRVTQRLFEGDRHRVVVAVPGTARTLAVTVSQAARPLPAVGDRVTLQVPRTAVHVLAGGAQGLSPGDPTDDP